MPVPPWVPWEVWRYWLVSSFIALGFSPVATTTLIISLSSVWVFPPTNSTSDSFFKVITQLWLLLFIAFILALESDNSIPVEFWPLTPVRLILFKSTLDLLPNLIPAVLWFVLVTFSIFISVEPLRSIATKLLLPSPVKFIFSNVILLVLYKNIACDP